eukprot:4879373-Alexandrium_andersonii.AAC.1
MSASLVGSEMCIRDRCSPGLSSSGLIHTFRAAPEGQQLRDNTAFSACSTCLLYTSDAADDM